MWPLSDTVYAPLDSSCCLPISHDGSFALFCDPIRPSSIMRGSAFSFLAFAAAAAAQGSLGGSQTSCSAAQAFASLGCYADSDNGAHAAFTWLLNSNANSVFYYPPYAGSLTPQICQTACRGHGFRYAGTYGGGSCYCSTDLPNPAAADYAQAGPGFILGKNPGATTAASNCQTPCTGDTSQYCGGSNAMQIYEDPSFTTDPNAAQDVNYVYSGCFSYTAPGPLYVTIPTDNTGDCASYCGALGYPIMGRSGFDSQSQASTCGCGSEVQTGNQVDDNRCDYYCDGRTNAK